MGLIFWTKFPCIALFLALSLDHSLQTQVTKETMNRESAQLLHHQIVNTYFKNRQTMMTSNLGAILFKNVNPQLFANKDRESRTFVVMLWMFWTEFVSTYLRTNIYDSESVTQEVLRNCRVKNCRFFSSYAKDIESADAVIFSTHQRIIPVYPKRELSYRWIIWNHGSPIHKTVKWSEHGLESLSGIFNWTMGYRSDSDIPIPFGRTVALPAPIEVNLDNNKDALSQLVPYWHKKQFVTLAMTLGNNCNAQFYTSLTKTIKVDIYWKSCPRDLKTDCVLPERYLFYIAFEESSCLQYITDAVFHHAYSKGAIPVISGPPVEDCKRLLPPNSFLHVKFYKDIPDLVSHMKEIANDNISLLTYHSWRQHFEVVNEHGFFNTTSYQLCRVCEALNFNDGEKNILNFDDLQLFYNEKLFCNLTYKCDSHNINNNYSVI